MIAKANDAVLGSKGKYTEGQFLDAIAVNLSNILFEATKGARAEVILCNDSQTNFRKQIYPNYKGSRTFNHDYHRRFQYVKDKLDYEMKMVEGLEADDVIYLNSDNNSIIVSNDHDLKQCGSKMFSPSKKGLYIALILLYHVLIGMGICAQSQLF